MPQFPDDVIANLNQTQTGQRESALTNYQNSASDGPAVRLGDESDRRRWAIAANMIHPGTRALLLCCPGDPTTNPGGTIAAQLATPPRPGTPENGVYYLVPGPGGVALNIGAPTAAGFGPQFRGAVFATTGDFSQGVFERQRNAAMGEWATGPYAAGNYTASDGAAWNVDAADQRRFRYMVIGKTLFLDIEIANSDVTGAAPRALQVAIPGGFVSANDSDDPGGLFLQNAGADFVRGSVHVDAGGTVLKLMCDGNLRWAMTTGDNTRVIVKTHFEIR